MRFRPRRAARVASSDAACRAAAPHRAVERLEARQLMSGVSPQAQPAAWHVRHDALAFYMDFTDADAGEAHVATADWGDGSPVETLLLDEPGTSPAGPAAGTAYGLHAYGSPGSHTVTLTLADAAGHSTVQKFSVLVGQPADEPVVGPTAPAFDPGDHVAHPPSFGNSDGLADAPESAAG